MLKKFQMKRIFIVAEEKTIGLSFLSVINARERYSRQWTRQKRSIFLSQKHCE